MEIRMCSQRRIKNLARLTRQEIGLAITVSSNGGSSTTYQGLPEHNNGVLYLSKAGRKTITVCKRQVIWQVNLALQVDH